MNIVQYIAFAITVVVFLGAVTVYLRGSKDAGTIKTLEKNNEALTSRVSILEAGEVVLTAKSEALEVRLAAVEEENRVLRQTRPSAEAIEDLHRDLRRHDTAPGSLAVTP